MKRIVLSAFMLFAVALSMMGIQSSAQDVKPVDPGVTVVVAPTVSEPSQASLTGFRKTLITAAEQSCKAGDITRLDLFKIRVASLNRGVLKQMHQAVSEQAIHEGVMKSVGAPDWSAFLDFIKQLLPIIMEIIKMFSGASIPTSHDVFAIDVRHERSVIQTDDHSYSLAA